jgi:hypothetical protein
MGQDHVSHTRPADLSGERRYLVRFDRKRHTVNEDRTFAGHDQSGCHLGIETTGKDVNVVGNPFSEHSVPRIE